MNKVKRLKIQGILGFNLDFLTKTKDQLLITGSSLGPRITCIVKEVKLSSVIFVWGVGGGGNQALPRVSEKVKWVLRTALTDVLSKSMKQAAFRPEKH